jgi:regulatory protein
VPAPRRITALEPDPRRPGAVRVLVDGRPWCTLAAEDAGRAGLAVGAELDPARAARAGLAADAESAYRAVLRSLERRAFATADLRRRLVRRGHPPEAVDQALARARAARLLDDESFACQFVETRARRGRGPARLRRDLLALGLDREVIERALAAAWPEGGDPDGLPRQLARKRAQELGDVPRAVKLRRLLAYLARRGWSGPAVTAMARRIVAGDG